MLLSTPYAASPTTKRGGTSRITFIAHLKAIIVFNTKFLIITMTYLSVESKNR